MLIQNYLDPKKITSSSKKLKGSLLRNLLEMRVFSMPENLSATTRIEPKNRRAIPEVFLRASDAMGWWASTVPHTTSWV